MGVRDDLYLIVIELRKTSLYINNQEREDNKPNLVGSFNKNSYIGIWRWSRGINKNNKKKNYENAKVPAYHRKTFLYAAITSF